MGIVSQQACLQESAGQALDISGLYWAPYLDQVPTALLLFQFAVNVHPWRHGIIGQGTCFDLAMNWRNPD